MKRHRLVCCLCPHGKQYLGMDLESVKIQLTEITPGTSGCTRAFRALGHICPKHRRMLKRVMGVTA